MRDPYDVLGVAKGTDIKKVKAAYRKLARELHPDLHPGDIKSEERFKEVAGAYDFLSDADKKAKYDRGEIDAEGQPKAERTFYRTYAEGGPGARYTDPREHFADFDNLDIFADLFRGTRHKATWQTGEARGADLALTLSVGLNELATKTVREVNLPGGKTLKVTIPAGSEDGDVLRLKGQGQPGLAGGPAGDLLIELKVVPHPAFTRNGRTIDSEVPISLPEAVLGGKIEVQTIDGPVSLTVPKGVNTGTRMRVRGKGLPPKGGGERGDHFVTLKVMLPKATDPELARWVEEWSAKHPYTVR